MTVKTKVGIIIPVTLLMGFGFYDDDAQGCLYSLYHSRFCMDLPYYLFCIPCEDAERERDTKTGGRIVYIVGTNEIPISMDKCMLNKKSRYMVFFHVSTFILLLHLTGGYDFPL